MRHDPLRCGSHPLFARASYLLFSPNCHAAGNMRRVGGIRALHHRARLQSRRLPMKRLIQKSIAGSRARRPVIAVRIYSRCYLYVYANINTQIFRRTAIMYRISQKNNCANEVASRLIVLVRYYGNGSFPFRGYWNNKMLR